MGDESESTGDELDIGVDESESSASFESGVDSGIGDFSGAEVGEFLSARQTESQPEDPASFGSEVEPPIEPIAASEVGQEVEPATIAEVSHLAVEGSYNPESDEIIVEGQELLGDPALIESFKEYFRAGQEGLVHTDSFIAGDNELYKVEYHIAGQSLIIISERVPEQDSFIEAASDSDDMIEDNQRQVGVEASPEFAPVANAVAEMETVAGPDLALKATNVSFEQGKNGQGDAEKAVVPASKIAEPKVIPLFKQMETVNKPAVKEAVIEASIAEESIIEEIEEEPIDKEVAIAQEVSSTGGITIRSEKQGHLHKSHDEFHVEALAVAKKIQIHEIRKSEADEDEAQSSIELAVIDTEIHRIPDLGIRVAEAGRSAVNIESQNTGDNSEVNEIEDKLDRQKVVARKNGEVLETAGGAKAARPEIDRSADENFVVEAQRELATAGAGARSNSVEQIKNSGIKILKLAPKMVDNARQPIIEAPPKPVWESAPSVESTIAETDIRGELPNESGDTAENEAELDMQTVLNIEAKDNLAETEVEDAKVEAPNDQAQAEELTAEPDVDKNEVELEQTVDRLAPVQAKILEFKAKSADKNVNKQIEKRPDDRLGKKINERAPERQAITIKPFDSKVKTEADSEIPRREIRAVPAAPSRRVITTRPNFSNRSEGITLRRISPTDIQQELERTEEYLTNRLNVRVGTEAIRLAA